MGRSYYTNGSQSRMPRLCGQALLEEKRGGIPGERAAGHRLGKRLVEGVAGASKGADRVGAARSADRLAQAPDMHVDGALVDIDVAAPHAVEELLAREDAAGALHQELQELELGRAEMELLAGAAHAVGLPVELDIAGGEEVRDVAGRNVRGGAGHAVVAAWLYDRWLVL